ncbi:MAG: glycosyltransferase family 2 protein [Armatimonadetes bacterium]|nr:glycosyltransferase family 2 protein [Armatimonadota bacterium]
MNAKVAIILVNWNGKSDTLECLESLRLSMAATQSAISPSVIVVDNGSRDDSVAAIRREFPHVTVLETGENLGFTGGNNVGIRHALDEEFDFLFLLNNDTIVQAGALDKLVEAAQNAPQFGLLTPVMPYFDTPQEIWFGGSRLDLKRATAFHDNRAVPAPDQEVQEIPWASGCAMLLPSGVMRQLGGFDDRFFLIWEDVDLSLRVRAMGLKIGLVPAARILHKVSRSFGGRSSWGRYYHVRNNLLLARTHCGRDYPRAARRVLMSSLRDALSTLKNRHREPRNPLLVTYHAWKDHFTARYGRCSSLRLLP